MKGVSIKLTTIIDKLVWIGIGLGVLSWIVEASIHVLVSPQDKFAEQLLTPPLHDICLRSVIAGLLIIFSVYAQFIINKRKRAEEALQEAHDELEQRVEERTAELARTGEQLRLELMERKRAEEELRKYRDHLEDMVRERTMELEAAQKELLEKERLAVLGQLTAMVSHELRNPLGVIGSSAYYLQRKLGRAEEKIAKHVGRIEEQVELCDSIVGELLEYTRGRRPELVQGEINQWLSEVLDELEIPGHVDIVREFSPELPMVHFDPEKMRRVVVNLLDNAFEAVTARVEKAHDEDRGYSPVVRVATSKADNAVSIEVADHGIGMDEDTASRAFEPLFTTHARGTGLGLAVVRKIVQEHGGSVSLESQSNHGTKVTVLIPLSRDTHARLAKGENIQDRGSL